MKRVLTILTSAFLLLTGCSGTKNQTSEDNSSFVPVTSSNTNIDQEGWTNDIKEEMMQYLDIVLPYIELDADTLQHGYRDDIGVYCLTDESNNNLVSNYGSLLSDAGFSLASELGNDFYKKDDVVVFYGWYEATENTISGNYIAAYKEQEDVDNTELFLIQEGYEKVNGWPSAIVAETVYGSGINLPSINENDTWFVSTEIDSNDYGSYRCAFLVNHNEILEQYAAKLARVGITYEERFESYFDESFSIEINMLEEKGFTFIEIYGPYIGSGGHEPTDNYFKKITSSDELVDGYYAIVCESTQYVFNGALEQLDHVENGISVTINNFVIESDEALERGMFEIIREESGYTVSSLNGSFINRTKDMNGLEQGQEPAVLSIDFDEQGNADIVSEVGAHLRFNANQGQNRFRFYKSATYQNQQPIQLYKFVEVE